MMGKNKVYVIIGTVLVSLCVLQISNILIRNKEDTFASGYHYSIPRGFMNDVQSIYKGSDQYYHFYYLSNMNYFNNNHGDTEWYHVKTKDFVHYINQGVAIRSNINSWQSVATGSIIDNKHQFYRDLPRHAIISYFTSFTKNGQNQYMAYSLNNGKTFIPYQQEPVMYSRDKDSNNRDPFVIYSKDKKKVMMYLAEGDKIGTYSSVDGKKFEYQGATILNKESLNGRDLGIVECPVIKTMYSEDDSQTKYVLFFGANGYNYHSTTGTYYVVGHLDSNGNFVMEESPKRLDQGSDFYGANFLQKNRKTVVALGWMGNWEYSTGKMAYDYTSSISSSGALSLARELSLVKKKNEHIIASRFITDKKLGIQRISGKVNFDKTRDKNNSDYKLLNVTRCSKQRVHLTFEGKDRHIQNKIQIKFYQKDNQVYFNYNSENGQYTVTRVSNRMNDRKSGSYGNPITVSSGLVNPKKLSMDIQLDTGSIEILFEKTQQTYTLVKYSMDNKIKIQVTTNGSNDLSYFMYNIENTKEYN